MFETFYPILFLVAFASFLGLLLAGFSVFLGRKTKLGKKEDAYECGVPAVGSTKERIPVKFYLVAILFILFDIEVIFLYPWAVISRNLGLFGFIEMGIFIVILLVGYFYVLGRGALKWD